MALVGIESRIERVESMLCIGTLDVCVVGIWGMAGIGKTTISEAVYKRNISQFESSHFFANVREQSEKHGPQHIRDMLLSKISSGKGNVRRRIPNSGFTFAKVRPSHRKVLIVLDDVNSSMQLQELLVEGRYLFGPGSKIIVTSRDRHVLKNGVDEIYDVEALNHDEALQLFRIHAFRQTHPFEEFLQQSKMVIYYARGNPLALTVLGCFLHRKSKEEWEIASKELRKTSDEGIKNVFRLSYDGLEVEDKEIFLDIVCFFKGEDVFLVKRILDGCGFSVNIGITNLIDQSLITISNDMLWMHDLLQEMGWEIVQQESFTEPGGRSRLWHYADICHVLTKNTGTSAVEGITLDLSETRELSLTSEAFQKMYNLRLLKFHDSDFGDFSKVHFPDEGIRIHSKKLRYFHWYQYPSKSLPANFFLDNLVVLNLPRSNIETLWEGKPNLAKLKQIDLRHSQYLTRIPDLSTAQNLESINVSGCTNLVDIPSSIQYLGKLEHLSMEGCRKLSSYPSVIASKHLKTLNLYECSNLQKFPEICGDVEEISLNFTAIEEVPSSIEFLTRLVPLNLNYCKKLKSLPSSICKLHTLRRLSLCGCSKLEKFPEISPTMEGLKYLNLSDCRNLTSVPDGIGNLKNLTQLYLNGTLITDLPFSINHLINLEELSLGKCKNLMKLPDSISGLKSLKMLVVEDCPKLEKLPENMQNLESLEELRMSGSAIKCLPSSILHLKNLEILLYGVEESAIFWEIPTALDSLSSLRILTLSGHNFEQLPASIEKLSCLEDLDVSYCKRLRSLPELPQSLIFLHAHECTSLESILSSGHSFEPNYEQHARNFKNFSFTNCFNIKPNALNSILADAVQRIQLMALASDHLYSDDVSIKIHLPGSRIPAWFCHRSMGHSVRMQLQNSRYSQLRGIALCALLEFEDNYLKNGLVIRCKCHFKTYHGESNDLIFNSNYTIEWRSASIPFKSSHLFIWDDPCSEAKSTGEVDWFSRYSELSFEFFPLDYEHHPRQGYRLTMCGIRVLCDDIPGRRIFSSDENDEGPYPKRSKYIDPLYEPEISEFNSE